MPESSKLPLYMDELIAIMTKSKYPNMMKGLGNIPILIMRELTCEERKSEQFLSAVPDKYISDFHIMREL